MPTLSTRNSEPVNESKVPAPNVMDLPQIEPIAPDDRPRVLLHMPVDVRSAALVIIAGLAIVYALNWAKPVLVPVLVGLMLSYALSPLVDRLERWFVPRVLGAGVLLIGLVGAFASLAWFLSDDTTAMIESLPEAAQKLRQSIRTQSFAPPGPIDKVQKAATELERAAEETSAARPASNRGVQRVVIEKPHFDIKEYLVTGTLGVLAFAGQATVVFFLTYFLLVSGDTFRRKMVKLAGPRLSQKKVTVQALDEIHDQIQRFLLVQLVTSAIVGIASWLALEWIGLAHAGVWGVIAGVTNFIPYLGAVIMAVGSAMVAFLQFGTLSMAMVTGGASFVIHGIVGNLLTPWLTSRASRMNPVAVFVGVLAWGWLWGAWGLILGVPILMVVKAVCDRVDDLKPIGELLGS